MNPNPAIIKLASGEALYANQALIKFIKSTISQTSDTLVSGDSIFFCKNVTFKRDRLSVAKENFLRTILLEKATAVIINTKVEIPTKSLALVGNKIVDSDPILADDIVYEITKFGSDYVDVVTQFYRLAQLSNKPKIVFEEKLLEMINSGFVINETNIDYLTDLLKSDAKMAYQIIDGCDIKESYPYVLWLCYFAMGLNSNNYSLFNGCPEIDKYLRARNARAGITKAVLNDMLESPEIKTKISATIIQLAHTSADSSIPTYLKEMAEDIRVDFTWK